METSSTSSSTPRWRLLSMAFRVEYTPSSAAPALYGAALGAGQEQYRQRRYQEQIQLAEMAQRERMQQRAQQAQLYSQAAGQAFNAQQAGLDRQFRAQQMQFGAAQDFAQQQQQFLQQQEQEQDQWLNQQEESGVLIRDAASRMKLQKIFSQQGAIRGAQNLTPQDKQMKLLDLQEQIRAEMRGGLREPLPGERRKSLQDEAEEAYVKKPVYDPSSGKIIGHDYYDDGGVRNGAKQRGKWRFEPLPTTSTGARSGRGQGPLDLSVPFTNPATGILDSIPVPPTPEEQAEYERAIIDEDNAPVLNEIEELYKVLPEVQFKGPNGEFFERDYTPQGFHPVKKPTTIANEKRQARAADMATKQAQLIEKAAEKKLRLEQDKAETAFRKEMLKSIIGETVKGDDMIDRPRYESDESVMKELNRRLRLLKMEDGEPATAAAQAAAKPKHTPPPGLSPFIPRSPEEAKQMGVDRFYDEESGVIRRIK